MSIANQVGTHREKYGSIGGPIPTSMNGVEIKFDVAQLCEILGIENVGMKIFESKSWPKVGGFSRVEAMQGMCKFPFSNVTTRPQAHSLIVLSKILQHMISYIFIPKGGHRDDVSYFEGFLVGCIWTLIESFSWGPIVSM